MQNASCINHAIVIPLVLGVFCGMVVQVYNTGTVPTYCNEAGRKQTCPSTPDFFGEKIHSNGCHSTVQKEKKSHHHIQKIKSYTLLLCHINITKLLGQSYYQ